MSSASCRWHVTKRSARFRFLLGGGPLRSEPARAHPVRQDCSIDKEHLEWWALIGPVPLGAPAGIIAVPHDRTRALVGPYQVGPLNLRPGGRMYREYRSLEPRQLGGVWEAESYPIIVEGDWADCRAAFRADHLEGQQSNERSALMALHRLCCLLALAWGEGWQVRTAPEDPERLTPEVPMSWPPPPMAPSPAWPLYPDPQPLPSWIAGAWDLVSDDDVLASAMTFWHQGLLLTTEFPSFALVAFSGCIETVAACRAFRALTEVDDKPCPTCGTRTGASRRFWSTIGLVADDDEVRRLRKNWDTYGMRSGVAHGRTTHGIETAFGSIFPLQYRPATLAEPARLDIDEADPAQVFTLRVLPAVRNVATRLLHKVFGAGAPR